MAQAWLGIVTMLSNKCEGADMFSGTIRAGGLVGLKSASPKSKTEALMARLKSCPDTKHPSREFLNKL